MTSVLETAYVVPARPYSQDELRFKRDQFFRKMRLGGNIARHERCDHYYYVKLNGRKDKQIKEEGKEDVGNCSVCWKISRTPHHLRTQARNLVNYYTSHYEKDPELLNYDHLDTEKVFYTWLYDEFN